MQINAGRRGCWALKGAAGERCCRSFFVDTRRYGAQCGEQRRRAVREREREMERVQEAVQEGRGRGRRRVGRMERRCVTVLYIPYRWFMQP